LRHAIVLTLNYTDTGWVHKLASAASAIYFTRGRVRFVSPDGDLVSPALGQAIVYFGDDAGAFEQVFNFYGFIVETGK